MNIDMRSVPDLKRKVISATLSRRKTPCRRAFYTGFSHSQTVGNNEDGVNEVGHCLLLFTSRK